MIEGTSGDTEMELDDVEGKEIMPGDGAEWSQLQ